MAKKVGLGRGLDALFADGDPPTRTMRKSLQVERMKTGYCT